LVLVEREFYPECLFSITSPALMPGNGRHFFAGKSTQTRAERTHESLLKTIINLNKLSTTPFAIIRKCFYSVHLYRKVLMSKVRWTLTCA